MGGPADGAGRCSARPAAQAKGSDRSPSSPAVANIHTIWACSTPTEPNNASPSTVPSTIPRKPAVPNTPTNSAMRSVGPRAVMNVIEAPYTPAMAQQKLMRST